MPYSDQTNSQLREKVVETPSIDSLINKLSANDHAKIIEKRKEELGSFAYFKLPKRFAPYQQDPDTIDYRFNQESFRRQEPI
jgi:hypothetical protein